MRLVPPNIPNGFYFDAAEHRYYLDRREIPGISDIVEGVFPFRIPERYAQPARERGTAIHLACQYDDEGTLDEGRLDPRLKPFLAAWRSFRDDKEFVPGPNGIEVRMVNRLMGYAGTIDRIGTIGKKRYILDIKHGGKYPLYRVKLAGYANLMPKPMEFTRCSVTLDGNGCYDYDEFTTEEFPGDLAVFQSCLNIYNFKVRYNL